MSTHIIPTTISINTILPILDDELRPPESFYSAGILGELPFTVVFNPDLSAAELTRLQNIFDRITNAKTDYSQLGQIRTDVVAAKDALTTYYNLTTPTNAQSVAAIKKLIEVDNLFLRIFIIILDYLRK